MVTAQAASGFLSRLLEAHAAFGKCKVTFAFSGWAFGQVDASTRSTVGEIRLRDLHIAGNLMVVAEILIDIGSRYFSGCNRADHGCRTGCTVATGENTRHVLDGGPASRLDHAPFGVDSLFYEVAAFDALTDRGDDDIAFNRDRVGADSLR